ncbi:MAG: hypothetical protein ACUVT4_04245 [Actinomycetota bacterium]
MKRKMRVLGLLGAATLLLVLLLGVPAQAANPEYVDVSAQVAEALRLSVNPHSIDFGGSLLPDGGPGQDGVYTQDLGATVFANRRWRLQVSKNHDLTSGSGTIPSSRLTFTSSSNDPRVTATQTNDTEFGTNTMVAEGNRGGLIVVTVRYRVDIEWEDAPDTYTATHTYSVVAQ